jgi:outer membrane protein assembly factor BamB
MSDPRDLQRYQALERFWDGLVRGETTPSDDLDPGMEAIARRVHALDTQPAPDPAFRRQLWEDLMNAPSSAGTIALPAPGPFGVNGRLIPGGPLVLRPATARQRAGAAIGAAILIAAVLALFFLSINDSNQATPPGPASPTSIPAPATLSATDWTAYQGGAARNGVTADAGPSSEIGALWTFQTPGAVISPVRAGDAVYAFDVTGLLYALDAATGEQRWVYATGAPSDNPEFLPVPAVAHGLVYVTGLDKTLHAVHAATGEPAWTADIGPTTPSLTAPAIVGDKLFVLNGSGAIYGFNALTGERLWRGNTGAVNHNSAAAAGENGLVYYGNGGGRILAFDGATGTIAWSKQLGLGVFRTPVLAGDTLYAAGYDATIFALDAATGEERWRYVADPYGFITPPAIANGLVVFAVQEQQVVAVDAATGAVVWTVDLPALPAPAIAGTVVYILDAASNLVMLDLATGQELGRSVIALAGLNAPPVIVDGTLYIGSSTGVTAYVTGPVETRVNEAIPPSP